jgi:hypothetical protein
MLWGVHEPQSLGLHDPIDNLSSHFGGFARLNLKSPSPVSLVGFCPIRTVLSQ